MSFTSEVKDELAHVDIKCVGCARAQLAALIRIEGTLNISGGQPKLEIITETVSVARTIITLLHSNVFDLQTDLMIRRSVLHKSHNFLITVPAQAKLLEALRDMHIVSQGGFEQGIAPALVENDCCAYAFLRGAFMAGGYVADPRGDFHFETTCASEALALDLVKLMARFGIKARSLKRHNTYMVYIKGAESIISFLVRAGAHKAALRMEEARVLKSVRNDTNRRVNAEIANQQKTTKAASEQIIAIRDLIEKRGIEAIPESLRQVALLRLQHPEASIKELGEYADPPLSKSAVYHRIRRINEMLED